jgi:hypothetical protein
VSGELALDAVEVLDQQHDTPEIAEQEPASFLSSMSGGRAWRGDDSRRA